ncbi:MAG: Transcriptional activator (Anti-sigma factor) protein [Hyphomicrobiales bacterium]|nr:Transcriptional activator (Anti-sigma factor) protein [Hyphomicrobiales bacterium]
MQGRDASGYQENAGLRDPAWGPQLDELLATYGAGGLDPARHALVASHLVLKPENRRFVRAVETLSAAQLMDAEALAPVADHDRRLAAIFAMDAEPAAAAAPARADDLLPAPLRRFIGCELDGLAWRFVVPGVRECKLGAVGGGDASLIHVRAGRRLPKHTHEGAELTLVLTGAFSDVQGRYGRGDIAIADGSIEHSPHVESDADCICFAVTDAPLRLTSPVGRFIEKYVLRRH